MASRPGREDTPSSTSQALRAKAQRTQVERERSRPRRQQEVEQRGPWRTGRPIRLSPAEAAGPVDCLGPPGRSCATGSRMPAPFCDAVSGTSARFKPLDGDCGHHACSSSPLKRCIQRTESQASQRLVTVATPSATRRSRQSCAAVLSQPTCRANQAAVTDRVVITESAL